MAHAGCQPLLAGKVPPPQSVEPLPRACLDASQSFESGSAATSASQLEEAGEQRGTEASLTRLQASNACGFVFCGLQVPAVNSTMVQKYQVENLGNT